MMKAFLLCFVLILTSIGVNAQAIEVKGRVTSVEDGEGVPGASVVIKGTTNGVSTDYDGNYTLKAESNDILVISFVGYVTQEVKVGNQTTINVVFESDFKALDEVVVIGYGSAKKEDLTGSVEAINSNDFNKGAIASPQELLTGKMAGVNITSGGGAPGTGAQIRIRGGSSLRASNDPLIIVDGVPLASGDIAGSRNPLNSINPNDIETFTVLKDASAAAIYGSRASNGVILITTKKGSGDGIQVEYTGNVSVGTRTGEIDVLNAAQYGKLVGDLYGTDSEVYALLGNADTDWQSELLSSSVSTDHNVSVSGVYDELLPYRVSLGYNNSNGMLDNSNLERTTAAINLSPKLFDDNLSVNLNLKGVDINNTFADAGAIGGAVNFDPTQSVTSASDAYKPFGGYFTWLDSKGSPIKIAPKNPVALIDQRKNTSDVQRFIGNMQLDYKFHFLPELKATLNVGLDHIASEGVNTTPINFAGDYNVVDPAVGGTTTTYEQTKTNKLLDFYLQYAKELPGINSKFDVMGGYSWQFFEWEQDNFSSNASRDPNYLKANSSFDASENSLVSFFGRFNFSYDERFLFTFTLRNDGSSHFSSDNQWGLFPAAAVAWNLDNENFIQKINAISQLKLRVGYGVTGQQDISGREDFPYLGTYTTGDKFSQYTYFDPNTGLIKYVTVRPNGYDKKIKWEETTTYNVGVDFGLFDDRLTGNVDAYFRETNDLINEVEVASGSNLTNQLITNVGSMENKGIEVALNGKIIQTEDMSWNLGANFTYSTSEITKLTLVDSDDYLGVEVGGISGGTGQKVQIHQVGEAPYSFLVYEQIYDTNGRPVEGSYVDRNNDGEISEADKYIAGDSNADFLLGLNTSFYYKNWEFSASGRAAFGQKIYNNLDAGNNLNGVSVSGFNSNRTTDVFNTMFNQQQYHSDYYVQNASFFRMDNITLGYYFQKVFGSETNIRLSGSVNNAFVISSYEGLDPEKADGIDNNVYPRPRTYMLGVNVTF